MVYVYATYTLFWTLKLCLVQHWAIYACFATQLSHNLLPCEEICIPYQPFNI